MILYQNYMNQWSLTLLIAMALLIAVKSLLIAFIARHV